MNLRMREIINLTILRIFPYSHIFSIKWSNRVVNIKEMSLNLVTIVNSFFFGRHSYIDGFMWTMRVNIITKSFLF